MALGKTLARSSELHLCVTAILDAVNTHLQLVEGTSNPLEVYNDVFECFVVSWAFASFVRRTTAGKTSSSVSLTMSFQTGR
jgi:hypothetical protein